MQNPVVAWLAVLGVAALAVAMRVLGSRRDEQVTAAEPRPGGKPRAEEDEADDEDESGDRESVAVTSEGWAFVPHGREVHIVPPGEPEEAWRPRAAEGDEAGRTSGVLVNPRTGGRLPLAAASEHLGPGDFLAARVARGATSVDPWRLEVLRRDRDFCSWSFETEEGARAALALVESRIVRPPRDEQGETVEIGAADFEAARREREEIEAELATLPDEEQDRDASR